MSGINYHNANDALAFLVCFAQFDVSTAKPSALANMALRLRFFWSRDSPWPDRRVWKERDSSPDVIAAYQMPVVRLLSDVANRRPLTIEGDLHLSFFGIPENGKLRLVVRASDMDRLRYQMIRVLEEVGFEKVLACPAPKPRSSEPCGRIFLKVTQKAHCSRRCQSRAYMRSNPDMRRPEPEKETRRGKKTRTR